MQVTRNLRETGKSGESFIQNNDEYRIQRRWEYCSGLRAHPLKRVPGMLNPQTRL